MATPPQHDHTFQITSKIHNSPPTSGTTLWNSFWIIEMNGKIPSYNELFFASTHAHVQLAATNNNTNLIIKDFVGWEKFGGGKLCHNTTTGKVSMPKGLYIFKVKTHDGYVYEWYLTVDTEQDTTIKRKSRKGAYLTNFEYKCIETPKEGSQFIGVPLSSVQAIPTIRNTSSAKHQKKRKSEDVDGCNKKVCQEGNSNTTSLFSSSSNDLFNLYSSENMVSFNPFIYSILNPQTYSFMLYLEQRAYEQFQNQTMFSIVPNNEDANQVMFTSPPTYSDCDFSDITETSNETINWLDEL